MNIKDKVRAFVSNYIGENSVCDEDNMFEIGSVMLNYIINLARKNNVKLKARFVETDRNRIMYMTYKFAGFKEILRSEENIILEADMSNERVIPDYYEIECEY